MMHRLLQNFVEGVSAASDPEGLRIAMADAAAAFGLSSFAYLSVSSQRRASPQLISTYPASWTKQYLEKKYDRFDPVIMRALARPEPFEWGLEIGSSKLSEAQLQLFEEAKKFGIRHGFTIPIHDTCGPIAAMTFAADKLQSKFRRSVEEHARVLQLMAMYFHASARRKLTADRIIDGVRLSPRELECLEWAARGKSAWEIGRILCISRHTAAFHLDNARTKLGVRSTIQAVARFVASKPAVR